MHKIEALLSALEGHLPNHAIVNESVSKASVGWHIEHSLLVINGILGTLIKSDPADYEWKFNKIRLYIFSKGKIPRGRGRAPEVVKPTSDFNPETINALLEKIRAKQNGIDGLTRNHFFKHPIFGKLNLRRSLKFIEMHTRHHLEIIGDLLGM